ncbi:MAG: HFX_2341 family transcriptional regulator domain-containing protein [Candidatus Helarchaeales archaeon]
MKPWTQIVLVGHDHKKLVESTRRYPLDRLVLVVGENPDLEGEEKVMETAKKVEESFKSLVPVEWLKADKEHPFQAARSILKKILEETKQGHETRINASGSLRQMAIASYIAALVSRTPIYSILPAYDKNNKKIGVKEIYELPFFPLRKLASGSIKMLSILEKEPIESIDVLVEKMFGTSKDAEYNKKRAKVSYYLKELEIDGFIKKQREGKRVSVDLTDVGAIYLLGWKILEAKNSTSEK